MIEVLFNQLFSEEERDRIRSRIRSEPTETQRKAWILFAYLADFNIYDIAWCTNRKSRQIRYLLTKAEDLFCIKDKLLTSYIEQYERKMEQFDRAHSEND